MLATARAVRGGGDGGGEEERKSEERAGCVREGQG